MSCDNLSYDNRETCVNIIPSSCIPYTGAINTSVQPGVDALVSCKPNINDILKSIQNLIDGITTKLGDNTTLEASCLDFNPVTVRQKDLNQIIIDELCFLASAVQALQDATLDPNTIMITIDLQCLLDQSCDPQSSYSLQSILVKLITGYCDLLTRVQNIETILNI